MSATELRQAAETLRERANAATPPPWTLVWDSCDCNDGMCHHGSWVHAVRFPVPVHEPVRPGGDVMSHHYEAGADEFPPETVEYIATMHPGVGLALADWLDYTFDQGHEGDTDDNGCSECDRAIALARLINGGAA